MSRSKLWEQVQKRKLGGSSAAGKQSILGGNRDRLGGTSARTDAGASAGEVGSHAAFDAASGAMLTPMNGGLDGMSASAPVQAKKKPKIEYQGGEKDTSPEAAAYMAAMRAREGELRANQIRSAAPIAPTVGHGGGEEAARNFARSLHVRGEGDNSTYMERSNRVLSTQGRAGALVNLGIRMSSDEPSRAEQPMRGDIYSGLATDYDDLFLRLEQGGLNTRAMNEQEFAGTQNIDKGDGKTERLAFAMGDGYDALNSRAMDMFSAYMLSDESLAYVKNFSKGVEGADVFGGQRYGRDGVSGFVLQTLINTVGANTTIPARDKRLSGDTQKAALNVGRTIGSLPRIAALPEENLPESLRPLRAKYLDLQEELDRRLQQG